MTPTFCCGFECGQLGGTIHFTDGPGTGNVSFSTSTVRNGARSGRCNPTASTGYFNSIGVGVNAVTVIRAYIRFATLPSTTCDLIWTAGGGGNNPGIYFKSSDSSLYTGTGIAALGATGVAVTTGVWYLIDLKVDLSNNPWLVDAKVDGVACGQKSLATGATSVNQWKFGTATSATMDMFFDDIVISGTSGDYPIGSGYVNHFVPTADGTHNVAGSADFRRGTTATDILNSTTTAYQLVDDVPLDDTTPDADDYINAIAPPNATDYVEVVFGPASGIATPTVGPRAVHVLVATHQVATQTGSFKLNLNDNGTLDTVKEQVGIAGVTTIQYANKFYATAPSTSATWTAALFNNLRMRFYSADPAPDQCWDCAMIEAEFAPPVPIGKIFQANQSVKRSNFF